MNDYVGMRDRDSSGPLLTPRQMQIMADRISDQVIERMGPEPRTRFRRGDLVTLEDDGAVMEVGIVDARGTFFDRSQPHYDCWITDVKTGERGLVKHVPESALRSYHE